jgi:predicted restriction endonuclease
MIREINNPKLSYNELKKHGLTNVRNQVSVNLELQEYIGELELIDLIRDVEDKGYIKECISKARVNQGKFREKLLRKYGKCCLCGLSIPDLLVASHIKPWNISSEKEKLSLDNGLLLCAMHDKLFDKGFISFDVNGQIIISDEISRTDYSKLNLDKKMKIAINKNMNDFMKYHRENIFIS